MQNTCIKEVGLTLIAKDGGRFSVSRRSIRLSSLLSQVIESDQECTEVQIPGITSDILMHVVDFLEHYGGQAPPEIKRPLRSFQLREITTPWNAEFIEKLRFKELTGIINAANYLDLSCLLNLGCARVAIMIRGKSPERIKRIFEDGAPISEDDREADALDDSHVVREHASQ